MLVSRIEELTEGLTDAEWHRLMVEWNQTAIPYPTDRTVPELVAERARKAPDATAVVFGEQRLTFGELNARADLVASRLRNLGIGPDTVVGVCVHRSLEMVVGELGVMKAGGAYMPMDPAYPDERLDFMLRDANSRVLLTQDSLVGRFTPEDRVLICLDQEESLLPLEADTTALTGAATASSTDLAYVIYTSGSTGRPKGVQIEHRSLLNLVFWYRRTFEITDADRATQVMGPAFDPTALELWPALTAGAAIYIADEQARLDPIRLRDWLTEQRITLTILPTPLAESVLKLDWSANRTLRMLLAGGDRLHFAPPASLPFPLVNAYGPTENTVVSTFCVVPPDETEQMPSIGRPMDNVRVYILDQQLRPLSPGESGELCVGGDGLARGYLGRPDLTEQRFVANPFAPGERLYRTGDLARYRPDGTLEFLGRIDQQVKIRGYRVELGEIEAVIMQHPTVAEGVVVDREPTPGNKQLAAYLVARAGTLPGTADLRRFLQSQLPEYMVPSAFVWLDRLPMTPNGKVDKQALPEPEFQRDRANSYEPPRTDLERRLAQIWEELLGVAPVGITDNFFELGGDSIRAVQVTARASVAGIAVTPGDLFQYPTVSGLAAAAEAKAAPIAIQAGEALAPTGAFDLVDLNADALSRILNKTQKTR